jgi:hypothetical protein
MVDDTIYGYLAVYDLFNDKLCVVGVTSDRGLLTDKVKVIFDNGIRTTAYRVDDGYVILPYSFKCKHNHRVMNLINTFSTNMP